MWSLETPIISKTKDLANTKREAGKSFTGRATEYK